MKTLRRLILAFFYLIATINYSVAQVGIGTASPNTSSILDINSTNKGLLIPRVKLTSETDQVSIQNPIESLLVYNTNKVGTLNFGFYYWNGAKWQSLITPVTSTSNNAWTINGNTATNSTNFLGTTDWNSLTIKVNNQSVGKFVPNGGVNFGIGSVANENYAFAIGNKSSATAVHSFAIGTGAKSENQHSFAIGNNAATKSNDSYAIGTGAIAAGYISYAMGLNAKTTQNDNFAIGNNSKTDGYQSISLGNGAESSSNSSFALGNLSKAINANSVAIGPSAQALQDNAIVLGQNNNQVKVGIGTSKPDEKLHLVGSIKIVDGTQGNGKVLLSDENGKAKWDNIQTANIASKTFAEISINNATTVTVASGTENLIPFNQYGENQRITLNNNNSSFKFDYTGHYKVTYQVSFSKGNNNSATADVILLSNNVEINRRSIDFKDSGTIFFTKIIKVESNLANIYSFNFKNSSNQTVTIDTRNSYVFIEQL
nr:hypothetical protein [uncultured Flavobacterium sp.]